jgi:hypothetical protein
MPAYVAGMSIAHDEDRTAQAGEDRGRLIARGPEPAAEVRDGADASGATGGLSLTAPLWLTGERSTEFLGCGFDSLDLSLYVEWQRDIAELHREFEAAKQRASGTKGIPFGHDGACLMQASGKARFAWHFEFPEFHLFVSRLPEPVGETPNAYVSLNSRTLWTLGVPGSLDLVIARVACLGAGVERAKPSRCDLAADYFIPGGLHYEELVSRRCPQHLKHESISSGDSLETWYFGSRQAPVRVRVYNKGREILHRGDKLWFKDVWERESVDDVWRVEYQVRREVLHRYKIDSIEDLQSNACGLWEYLTNDWFSLREQDNGHTTRRTVSPWWRHVQSVGPIFGTRQPLARRDQLTPADCGRLLRQFVGCGVSLAALRGKLTHDEAMSDLTALLRGTLSPQQFEELVRILCIQRGIPLPDVGADS